jgi:hypothetical protein
MVGIPDLVDQCEGDAAGAEQIEKRLGKPAPVSDFDGVPVSARQALKISRKPRKKFPS